MTRIGLSLVLLAEAFFGPSLCCCTFAPGVAGESSAETQADSPTSCCCCIPVDEPKESPQQHTPAPTCPCREGQSNQVAGVLPAPAAAEQAQRFLTTLAFTGAPLVHEGTLLLQHSGTFLPTLLPFLSAQDLIDVHHLMRC